MARIATRSMSFEDALFGSREATVAYILGRKPKASKEKGTGSREAAAAACPASICCRRYAAQWVQRIESSNPWLKPGAMCYRRYAAGKPATGISHSPNSREAAPAQ